MCLTIYIFMYGNLDFQIPQIMDSLIPFFKLASPFIINIRNHIQYSNAKIRARSTEYTIEQRELNFISRNKY